MEKYHDLPDIDTNAPDVFETSDVESDLELSHHHSESSPTLEEDDSEIKHQQLNAETARTRFSHSLLVPQDGADFLGSVSYPKLAWEIGVFDRDNGRNKTTEVGKDSARARGIEARR